MRGRITADEDAWLYHKWKPEVDVDSLLQATLPRGPVEDEVDTYEALALAGRVSELSNKATPGHSDFVISLQLNRTEDMCLAFHILHDVLYEGKVARICL